MNKKSTYFKQKKAKNKTNVVLKSINSIKKTENGKIIYFFKSKKFIVVTYYCNNQFFCQKEIDNDRLLCHKSSLF